MSCFVCDKHQSISPVHILTLKNAKHIVVSHMPDLAGNNQVYLGALLIEPKRHVQNWSELNDAESIELAATIKELNRALYSHDEIAHVYTWVFGDAVEHMHVWIMPRYVGTPREYWGTDITRWPDAKKGGTDQMAEVIEEFQALLSV